MSKPTVKRSRLVVVDALRGLAILLMVVFHFCFDLSHFGFADFDFYEDPFWLHARTFILSLFLLLVGVSLVLATRKGINRGRFLRRLGLLVASAALVSVSTWWMFGERVVFFGVLHFIALASVLGLLFVRRVWVSLVLGAALILLGNLYASVWFDQPGWRWIGLMTHKPATEDYVPLLPWFGVVLIGIVSGQLALRRVLSALSGLALENSVTLGLFAFSGRHSLLIYLLHQPLLFGLFELYLKLAP